MSQRSDLARALARTCGSGDVAAAALLLDRHAVAHRDAHRASPASHRPVQGAEQVAALLRDLVIPDAAVLDRTVHGRPGLVFVRSNTVTAIAALAVRKRRVAAILIITDPQTLRIWATRFGPADMDGDQKSALASQ